MTKETKIRQYSTADDTELRSFNIHLGDKTIKTPTKAVLTNNFYKETTFPSDLSDIQELFVRLDDKTLVKADNDNKYSSKKNNDLGKQKDKANGCPHFCLLEFKNKGEEWRYPTEYEIEVLTNLAYSHSSITPIPSIPKVARKLDPENFDFFLEYLDTCYNSIEVRNKKSILGYIPAVAPAYGRALINFYLDRGINAYYIDFDGTMVKSRADTINAMKVELAKRGYEENNFFHYVNASYGKAINDEKVLSARDLLGFGYGLDSLGGVHAGPRRDKAFYEKLKEMKDVTRNVNRLLNVEDYGYYRFDTIKDNIESFYPENALIEKEELFINVESRVQNYLKIVNLQQQCIEADKLTQIVDENPDKSLDYYKSKKNVKDTDLKDLSKNVIH
ncbi:hypothetical protein FXV91_17330 [Methanosarcina sp. DH2]|uniref:hypothetical protein n=1 Tax=Methanosarcina sp. DH2 TaxID=2605639 RepID=UPI001E382C97|nr:hypothetical protein [Methanosarcina sp. DH2]MCC4771861.1 hypothetical protein [Methanosarcina sp. DH2]